MSTKSTKEDEAGCAQEVADTAHNLIWRVPFECWAMIVPSEPSHRCFTLPDPPDQRRGDNVQYSSRNFLLLYHSAKALLKRKDS
jgi:hypothetical protein